MNKTGRLVVGALALIFAIVLFVLSLNAFDKDTDQYYGVDAEYEVYGGDAYTGIQNAAVDTAKAAATTARRVNGLNNTVAYIGGGLLLAASFCFLLVSAWALLGGIGGDSKKSAPTYIPVRPQAATQPPPQKLTPPAVENAVNKPADTQAAEDNSFWICSTCKTKNLKTRDTCWSCGKSNSVDAEIKN